MDTHTETAIQKYMHRREGGRERERKIGRVID